MESSPSDSKEEFSIEMRRVSLGPITYNIKNTS